MRKRFLPLFLLLGYSFLWPGPAAERLSGGVRFRILDMANRLTPCRVHLRDAAGKPVRADALPFWRDHFVCAGEVELKLPPGTFRYEVERGPEFGRCAGTVAVGESERKEVVVPLKRLVDLAAEGWYGGDLHVHRAPQDVPLLMQAEDLHVAPVITWWNNTNPWAGRDLPRDPLARFDGNRFHHLLGGEDERGGGALLYLNGSKPLAIAGSAREHPSPMKFVAEARRDKGWWIDIEKPFWWDVPVWLASAAADSVGIAHNHMHRGGVMDNEAWGRPRLRERYPGPHGNGLWTQEIYYHALNGGLRLPPSAGSASGVLPNPVGYNRVYVHVGRELTWDGWWQGLKAGRSFVTNGPLLRCTANGQLPGHVFTAGAGKEVDIDLRATLTSADPVRVLEVIRDGRVERSVPVGKQSLSGGLGQLRFRKSGWFLVRAMADVPHTFRFASTAPFHVEVGPRKRTIHKESVLFFLGWIDERTTALARLLPNAQQRQEVLAHHEQARKFWQALLAEAVDHPRP